MKIAEFDYGALALPLEKQAEEQGLTLGADSGTAQYCIDAIHMLTILGILKPEEKKRCIGRLHGKVSRMLKDKIR